MCNLSTGIEERAMEKATEKTSKKCILNMYKKGYTLDQIADVAETSTETKKNKLQIADHVWNYDFDYDSNVVDVYVRYLRNKIDKGFACPLIHTVRGCGYVVKYANQKN